MANSHRHHYIPRFHINKFKGQSGVFYVYDKQKDLIREYPSSKMFFFESNRNTFTEGGKEYSLLEDDAHSKIDAKLAPIILRLSTMPTDENLFNDENISGIMTFVIDLFWRIPKTDCIWNDLYNRIRISVFDSNKNQIYNPETLSKIRESEMRNKFQRTFMAAETTKRLGVSNDSTLFRMLDITGDKGYFLLGDNPMVYNRQPSTLEGIINQEHFLPLSSNRIYFTAANCELNLTAGRIFAINTIIIEQSMRLVCGANKEYLEMCIRNYKLLRHTEEIQLLRFLIFSPNVNLPA